MKFLIIDDNEEIIESVSRCLSLRWPQSDLISADQGKRGLQLARDEAPDLVILDISLPDIGGLEVLRSLRSFSDVPVVILTVRDQDVEVARFLEEGADDYVVKPFSHVELLGRIQAIFRRAQGRMGSSTQTMQAADLLMDFGAAEIYKGAQLISLTRTEMSLLMQLARNATRVVSYESLASNVLQVKQPDDSDNRLIKVHVQHLRSKLEDSAENPQYISNVYGVGYKFLPQATSPMAGANGKGNC